MAVKTKTQKKVDTKKAVKDVKKAAKAIAEVKTSVPVKIKNMMKKVDMIQVQEALLKKQKDALKAEVKQFMKDNKLDEILYKDVKALYCEFDSETFDKDLFKSERPKLYEKYLKTEHKTRFEIKGAKAGK